MTFGIQQHLSIRVFKDAAEATEGGFNYERPEYQPAEILQAIVVRDGTVRGSPSVDLVFVDEHGNKYVCMITGKLLEILTESSK